MRGLQSFRWPVKLAMLVIALLAVIAIGSGWWLPWIQRRLTFSSGCYRRAQRTGSAPIISAGIFSHACWPPPAFRWGR